MERCACAFGTQVIKACGLIDDRWYTEQSRQRGTAVHLATQLDDEGDLAEETVSPTILPYLEAARRFRRECGFVAEMIESRFCHVQFGYAGTIDRMGLMNKRRSIVDFKSGEIGPWVKLQVAAYSMSMPNGASFDRYAVQLCPDGFYKLHAYPVKDMASDFKDFLACLRVYQMKEGFACLPQ